MYMWNATQPKINKPLLAVGGLGKIFAVLLSANLYLNGMFSRLALRVMSGDLRFAGFWLYWLLWSHNARAA